MRHMQPGFKRFWRSDRGSVWWLVLGSVAGKCSVDLYPDTVRETRFLGRESGLDLGASRARTSSFLPDGPRVDFDTYSTYVRKLSQLTHRPCGTVRAHRVVCEDHV
jgi:hypothetical protein